MSIVRDRASRVLHLTFRQHLDRNVQLGWAPKHMRGNILPTTSSIDSSGRWHPKLTPHRMLVLFTTIGFGTAKAYATSRGLSLAATTVEWISAVVIFSVLSCRFTWTVLCVTYHRSSPFPEFLSLTCLNRIHLANSLSFSNLTLSELHADFYLLHLRIIAATRYERLSPCMDCIRLSLAIAF